jgi:ribosomal protein L37AE/L43A
MKEFGVYRCPECGKVRIIKMSRTKNQCFKCGVNRAWNPKKELARVMFSSDDIRECQEFITNLFPHPQFEQATLNHSDIGKC